jgi:hypothetical protein
VCVCERVCVCVCECVCVCVRARASLDLLNQHAKRMRLILLSYVASLAVPYFFTLSHKRHDFQKMPLNIKCLI